jgi:hypothetical protein
MASSSQSGFDQAAGGRTLPTSSKLHRAASRIRGRKLLAVRLPVLPDGFVTERGRHSDAARHVVVEIGAVAAIGRPQSLQANASLALCLPAPLRSSPAEPGRAFSHAHPREAPRSPRHRARRRSAAPPRKGRGSADTSRARSSFATRRGSRLRGSPYPPPPHHAV